MADIKLEDTQQYVTTEGALQLPTNSYADIARKEELKKSRSDTDFFSAETFDAVRTEFGKNNYINMGIEKAQLWLNTRENEDDSNFIEQNSDERVNILIQEHGLRQNDFFELRDAKNAVNEGVLIDTMLDKQFSEEFAQKHLSATTATVANVTGSLLDIDVALLGPLTATLSKGKKIADIGKIAFGIEASAVPVRDYLDPTYDAVRDGLLDITVGVVLETSVAKYLNKDFDADLRFQRELAVNNQKDIDEFVMENQTYWKEQEIKDLEKKQMEVEKQQVDVAQKHRQSQIDDNNKILSELKAAKNVNKKAVIRKEEEIKKLEEQQVKVAQENRQSQIDANNIRLSELRKEQGVNEKEMARKDREIKKLEAEQVTIAQENRKSQVKTNKERLNKVRVERIVNENAIARNDREIKKLEERQVKVAQENRKSQIDDNEKILSELETKSRLDARKQRVNDTIESMARSIQPEIERIKTQLTDIATTQTKTQSAQNIKELEDTVAALRKEYPDLADEVIKSFENIKRKNVELSKGHFTMAQKMGIASLATVAVANADSFGESGGVDNGLKAFIISAAIIAFAGPKVLRKLKQGGLRNALSSSASSMSNMFKMSEYSNTVSGNKITKIVADTHQKANTAFNSMYKELLAFNDKRVSKIADILLFNPITGKNGSVDAEKMTMLHGDQAKIAYVLKATYKEWIAEQGIGKSTSWIQAVELQSKYNKLISDAIEGLPNTSSAINTAVKEIRQIIKTPLDYAKQMDVKGATAVESSSTYLTRFWDFSFMTQIVKSGDKQGIEQLTINLSEVIKSPNPYDTAKRMVGWFSDSKNIDGHQAEDILTRLEDFLKGDVNLSEAEKALEISADRASRLKERIDIDLHNFKPLNIMIDGKPIKVQMDRMVERDISLIMDRYLNQMYGSIALAKRGYTSVTALRKEIKDIGGEAGEVLGTVLDLTLGVPLRVANKHVHEISTIVRNTTFVASLPLVAYSMTTEAIKVISNTGLGLGLKNFQGAFKTMDKKTSLYKTISSLTGLSTHKLRDKVDIKGLDNSDFGELATSTGLGALSTEMVQTAAKVFGLVKGTDIFESFTMLKSNDNLARFVHGKENDIPKARLESYGITEETKTMFKDNFKFNSNDDLLDFDPKDWDYNKRAAYNNIILRMNQEISPVTLMGTIGRWTKDNDLGRMFSFLLNYPLNLYGNQAVKDAHFMDARAASNLVYSFGGTYMGLMARYESQGKDYTHEDLMLYSLLNMPSLALFSAMKSLSDPATVHTASGFKDDIATLAGTVAGTGANGKF